MSASLLRGLRILEMLRTEPLGVSEVARRLQVDKAGVSRVLRALLEEGWVERTGRLHVLGPRALLLSSGAFTTPLRGRAVQLARRLRDQTGQTTAVVQLRTSGAHPLAVEPREPDSPLPAPAEPANHLWETAAGLALLAQLPPADLSPHLDVSPWPTRAAGAPRSPEEVHDLLDRLRRGEPVVERSWNSPGIGCLALPWPLPRSEGEAEAGEDGHDAEGPAALVVVGPEQEILRDHDRLAELLRAAAEDVA
ncbi:helix-turn-helix domain-containing protein [Nocardioides campestrisoli]|uniref:helix-turn-helix domain-containing protein n=1 Tax=Nocardioides campestrisoli TaxID=2736757 RepID=UPI0015E70C77|nr:helix-turn-helix domain-containing protein [Nocardioides campestrisoli]